MSNRQHAEIVDVIRSIYGAGAIPLHRPVLGSREKQWVSQCVDSGFVSSAGALIAEFEQSVSRFTGAAYAVATVNGTAALHLALIVAGVERGEEVLTQALTFVATCNAVRYAGADPVFIDVDMDTMAMSPHALRRFLDKGTLRRDGQVWNRQSGRRLAACLPMHTFGFPARMAEIADICAEWDIPLVEDAAESLGSRIADRHTGTFGCIGTLSFNGNKIVTTGGGGMLILNDEQLARRARHLSTTAKVPHEFEFVHDELGYNYRLPNLNAALGCAQMEQLDEFLAAKAGVARRYGEYFDSVGIPFARARAGTTANHWLNAIQLQSLEERDEFIEYTNRVGVMTRPVWRLMTRLEMYAHCESDDLVNSRLLEARVVNLPSSVPDGTAAVGT